MQMWLDRYPLWRNPHCTTDSTHALRSGNIRPASADAARRLAVHCPLLVSGGHRSGCRRDHHLQSGFSMGPQGCDQSAARI